MPIYEYECQKCGRSFEYMQGMSEAPKKKCEVCRGKLQKKISAAGFILKGGGWYKDLYSLSRPEKAEKAEKADKADKADKAETKSEKPETKTETKPGAKPGTKPDKKAKE